MTEQKYAPVGDSTTLPHENGAPIDSTVSTPPPVAQNAAKTPPMADNRPINKESHYVRVNQNVYSNQLRVLISVDSLLDKQGAGNLVEVINSLIYAWIGSGKVDLAKDANSEQLFAALRLVNFLTEIGEDWTRLSCIIDQEQEVYRD
ncbi:hypothetical protein GCM10028808_60630 [Spirosoma migulaei]